MIPTLVITLREGLEAALIVGIVAAFLVREGRRDALRAMWIGVAVAIVLCVGVAAALRIAGESLPQREQEGLETIVGLIAVAMITYMVVWMRRHSRELKGQLETRAALALSAGSGLALAFMAFFAVLREGLETAIFLLAAFQQTADPLVAGLGALIGVLVAVGLGYGIYRGGVRIDMARFFKVTGVVLVFVAGGLLASAVHEFAEAGVLTLGQDAAFDLSWLVSPGSVQASLITGMFGLQPVPSIAEVTVWLAYVVPMTVYILKPVRHTETAGARTVSTAA
jgi:high-affinity iron transporter